MKKNQPLKKRSNEPIMKIIEKKFDSYPYEGSEEFEKLKKNYIKFEIKELK
jgi:Txe/YoeB family toxin of Txe-Axe toxin-antitoxin module